MVDLVIKNGTVVKDGRQQRMDIGVTDGRIGALYRPGMAPDAPKVIDASGSYVLPGFVDAHVHTRAPARPDRETWASGTSAAASSGVTTILEMPQSNPATTTVEILKKRRDSGETSAYIDFGLYAGGAVDPKTAQQLADEGVIGFKIFTHRAPVGRGAEFNGLVASSPSKLFEGMKAVAATGLVCAIHCEDDDLIEHGIENTTGDVSRVDAHAASRPPFVEAVAISEVLVLAEKLSCAVHLVHVSSAWGAELAQTAKRRGVDVSVETCPHYLVCDENDASRIGPAAKINPPLRSAEEQKALWRAVNGGLIDIIASDHSPSLPAEKQVSPIWDAPAGHPELDTAFPAILDAAARGLLSFGLATALLSTNPAKRFGLASKGSIEPGKDADFAIVDPEAEWTVEKEKEFSLSRASDFLYDGRAMKGRVTHTICRGTLVYENGEIVGDEGHGQFVTPTRRSK